MMMRPSVPLAKSRSSVFSCAYLSKRPFSLFLFLNLMYISVAQTQIPIPVFAMLHDCHMSAPTALAGPSLASSDNDKLFDCRPQPRECGCQKALSTRHSNTRKVDSHDASKVVPHRHCMSICRHSTRTGQPLKLRMPRRSRSDATPTSMSQTSFSGVSRASDWFLGLVPTMRRRLCDLRHVDVFSCVWFSGPFLFSSLPSFSLFAAPTVIQLLSFVLSSDLSIYP